MPTPTIRSITLACLTLVPALVIACDRDEDTEEARSAEQADVDDDDDDARGDHHRKSPADKLCAAVECTDAQRTQITGLVAGKKHERPSEETFATANGELAGAFRDPDFEAADVAAWRDAVHGEKSPKLAPATIVAVHDVLDARQRGVLADLFEDRGGGMFFGHRGKGGHHGKGDKAGPHGKKGGKGGKHGPEFAVESLCERVSCTAEQRSQIATALGSGRPERTRDEAADKKMAAAFRADTLAVADVEAYMDGMKKHHEAEMAQRDAAVVSIHRVLTPEQRATLAADIAEHGPRGLIKGPGHHKGKGHKGKGHKGKGKRDRDGGEQPA